jgi:hypothetical protein
LAISVIEVTAKIPLVMAAALCAAKITEDVF